MQIVDRPHGAKVFLPDVGELGYKLAHVDSAGWVTIGETGSVNYLMLDVDEWLHFARFVVQT